MHFTTFFEIFSIEITCNKSPSPLLISNVCHPEDLDNFLYFSIYFLLAAQRGAQGGNVCCACPVQFFNPIFHTFYQNLCAKCASFILCLQSLVCSKKSDYIFPATLQTRLILLQIFVRLEAKSIVT